MATSITMISDTHNYHDLIDVGSGDLILHAGDCTSVGKMQEIETFLSWYGSRDYECKVLIPGNHDFGFEDHPDACMELARAYGVTLLDDSGHTYRGIKIWGSPVQPYSGGWAFNRHEDPAYATPKYPWIKPHWNLIPEDTDILITHGPAYGILDATLRSDTRVGSPSLFRRIRQIKPVLHVCGHIHESRGYMVDDDTVFVNASSLNRRYEPYNWPVFKTYWESVQRGIFP